MRKNVTVKASGTVVMTLVVFLLSIFLTTSPIHAQETFTVELAVTTVTVDQLGVVWVSGTVTCSEAVSVGVNVDVRQPVGRWRTIYGSGGVTVENCDADGESFSVPATAESARFGTGIVYVNAYTGGCIIVDEYYTCDDDHEFISARAKRS